MTGTIPRGIAVFDSVTKLAPADAGLVIVAASHGGIYPAYLAASGRCRGVILNDAGRGKDDAGIASLAYLDRLGIPAAVIGHDTARIGDGADMMRRGIISATNDAAYRLGCRVGQGCAEAAEAMTKAEIPQVDPPPYSESRVLLRDGPVLVWGLDSNSLVAPTDRGTIVVTGSHGGLLGGRPETAIRVDALAAIYHDAGIGIDEAGISRLPALDARGIAGATVAGDSARIGDARSVWETGRLSHVNGLAASWGAVPGMSVPAFADLAAAHADPDTEGKRP